MSAAPELFSDGLLINPDQLNEDFIRLPGDLAYWSTQYAEACLAYSQAKAIRKATYGRLTHDIEFADFLSEKLGKKVTQQILLEAINDHEDFKEAQEAENQAEFMKTKCRGMLDAINAKRDALISLGATRREEMKMDPTIRGY